MTISDEQRSELIEAVKESISLKQLTQFLEATNSKNLNIDDFGKSLGIGTKLPKEKVDEIKNSTKDLEIFLDALETKTETWEMYKNAFPNN